VSPSHHPRCTFTAPRRRDRHKKEGAATFTQITICKIWGQNRLLLHNELNPKSAPLGARRPDRAKSRGPTAHDSEATATSFDTDRYRDSWASTERECRHRLPSRDRVQSAAMPTHRGPDREEQKTNAFAFCMHRQQKQIRTKLHGKKQMFGVRASTERHRAPSR